MDCLKQIFRWNLNHNGARLSSHNVSMVGRELELIVACHVQMFLAGPCSVTVPMSLPRRTSKPSAEQPEQPQQQQEAGLQTEQLPEERRDEERVAGPAGDRGLPWL